MPCCALFRRVWGLLGSDVQAVGMQSKVGQGYKFSSVGSRFKRQLGELMEALHRMEPHYIRCIKPNSFNRSCSSASLQQMQPFIARIDKVCQVSQHRAPRRPLHHASLQSSDDGVNSCSSQDISPACLHDCLHIAQTAHIEAMLGS